MQKRSKSQARKDYWATISPEERKRRASKTAKAKHAKLTPQQRKRHALVMLSARNGVDYLKLSKL